MIKEQKFDNCEEHGLQHAWKVFEIRQRYDECLVEKEAYTAGSSPKEIPVREEPYPFIRRERTHIRKCQNCCIEEAFEIEETRKWLRK